MELHLIIFLLISQIGAIDEESNDISGDSKCLASGACEGSDLQLSRTKRAASQVANKLTFLMYLSEKVVKTLGRETLLNEIENFLHNEGVINSNNMFQPEMHQVGDEQQAVSFVIPTMNGHINDTIEKMNLLITDGSTLDILGFYSNFVTALVANEEVIWNGMRTVVRFKLIVEYSWIITRSLLESINNVATFLNEKFELYLRDIYDLQLTEAETGRTLVEFALPPVVSNANVSDVLENITELVGMCGTSCLPSDSSSTENACQTCLYVNFFGMNIYVDPDFFDWMSKTWTGDEVRYEFVEADYNICSDHQELCVDGVPEPTCVGIGRCDKYFYNKVQVTIVAHGSIQLLDIYGLEYSKEVVRDSLSELHGICKSSIEIIFFGHGRDTFGISVVLAPSIGRDEGAKKLDEMVKTQSEIASGNLVISKVEGSYRKSYLDLDKPTPKFIDNDCFGCDSSEVWCILSNISLCMVRPRCIDLYYSSASLKIANSTEIIKFNVLLTTVGEYHIIDDTIKLEIKLQIATQLNSRLDIITHLDVVPSFEDGYFELGLVVTSLHNNTELKNIASDIHRLTDKAMLQFITTSAEYRAVPESVLFRQYISGYPKPKQDESDSNDLGNTITSASIAVVAGLVITIITIGKIWIKRGRPYSNALIKGNAILDKDKIGSSRQSYQTFMHW